MINLITSFFIPKEIERQEEILKCLKYNVDCPYFKKIYLFIEKKEDIVFLKDKLNPKGKIQLILWNNQPTYADYLKQANQLQGQICMISNADIWLKKCDEELINLLYKNPKIAYSLTRYDSDKSNNHKLYLSSWPNATAIGCFDSFIFKSPINIDYSLINHIQNRPGSEHIFKTELEYKGIRFYNLCYDICIVHEHLSNVRTYTSKDELLWEIDLSGNYIKYKYTKALTPTPPQKKLTIMGNYFKKPYSTIRQMF